MSTFTAKKFEFEFYRAMFEWVAGGKTAPDPRGEWEFSTDSDCWIVFPNQVPAFAPHAEYRWKPAKKRTVSIDGLELVAPEIYAPKYSTDYYIELFDGIVDRMEWGSHPKHTEALLNGKVFLTRQDAQAMSDVLRKLRMRGTA